MKSELYAIADAGGNIYPGTFGKNPEGDWFKHLLPHMAIVRPEFLDEKIKEAKERGDHVVKCSIETNEIVAITQL